VAGADDLAEVLRKLADDVLELRPARLEALGARLAGAADGCELGRELAIVLRELLLRGAALEVDRFADGAW